MTPLFTSLFLLFLSTTEAFTLNAQSAKYATSLPSTKSNEGEESNDYLTTRRKSVVQASATILASAATILSPQTSQADEGSQDGKLIEFLVENVGGEPGNTGRIVIKTHPEWAPNGVNR